MRHNTQTHVQMAETFFKAKYFKGRYKQNTILNSLSCLFVINLKEKLEKKHTTALRQFIWGLLDLVDYYQGGFPKMR